MKSGKLALVCGVVALLITPRFAFAASGGAANSSSMESAASPYIAGEIMVKFKRNVPEERKKQTHTEAGAELVKVFKQTGWHHVRSRHGESAETLLSRYRANPDVEYAEPNFLYRLFFTPNGLKFTEQ